MLARARRTSFELWLGAIGAAFVTLAFVFARTGIPGWIPPALGVRAGIASPLTGMTRSFVAFARGDFLLSLGWHPLGPVCFVASVAAAIVGATSLAGARWQRLRVFLRNRLCWSAVATAFFLAWIRQALVVKA